MLSFLEMYHTGLVDELTPLVTGRTSSLFEADVGTHASQLRNLIEGSRVLVIGGAGSIGSATIEAIIPFNPRAIHVVDQNENGLAELIRDLRCRYEPHVLGDFRTLPLNFGSPVFARYLAEEAPYDYVLNFAALKHVRSEKDVYSLLQMLDTNVLKPALLLRRLLGRGGLRGYFCVSTDKAANPVNLMGASKRLMEHAIFSEESGNTPSTKVTSARFANVAFSEGSLLQSWLIRLQKSQPMAVPKATRRFFISLGEAGHLCLLAAFLAPHRHLLVPRLDPRHDQRDLADVATSILQHLGLAPRIYEREADVRASTAPSPKNGSHPLLLTALDTSGEKACEEFLGEGEKSVELGMRHSVGVCWKPAADGTVEKFLRNIQVLVNQSNGSVSQRDIKQLIASVVPEFHHNESTSHLDQRI